MIFTLYYMYATFVQWWRLGTLKNKINGTLNSQNALLVCAGVNISEPKNHRCLETLLFSNDHRIGCTVVPKQKINLSSWLQFPKDEKYFPIHIGVPKVYLGTQRYYILMSAQLDKYLAHEGEVIQIETFGEPVAWKASENFEVILKTDDDNLTKLVNCFFNQDIDINHELRLLKLETVDVEGLAAKIKYDKKFSIEQRLKYSHSPVHWRKFAKDINGIYAKINESSSNPKITIENGNKSDDSSKKPVSEVKPMRGKSGKTEERHKSEKKNTLEVQSRPKTKTDRAKEDKEKTREHKTDHKEHKPEHKADHKEHKSDHKELKNDHKEHKTDHKEHKTDHKEHKIDYKEHKTDHKEHKNDHKEHKNDHKEHKSDHKHHEHKHKEKENEYSKHKESKEIINVTASSTVLPKEQFLNNTSISKLITEEASSSDVVKQPDSELAMESTVAIASKTETSPSRVMEIPIINEPSTSSSNLQHHHNQGHGHHKKSSKDEKSTKDEKDYSKKKSSANGVDVKSEEVKSEEVKSEEVKTIEDPKIVSEFTSNVESSQQSNISQASKLQQKSRFPNESQSIQETSVKNANEAPKIDDSDASSIKTIEEDESKSLKGKETGTKPKETGAKPKDTGTKPKETGTKSKTSIFSRNKDKDHKHKDKSKNDDKIKEKHKNEDKVKDKAKSDDKAKDKTKNEDKAKSDDKTKDKTKDKIKSKIESKLSSSRSSSRESEPRTEAERKRSNFADKSRLDPKDCLRPVSPSSGSGSSRENTSDDLRPTTSNGDATFTKPPNVLVYADSFIAKENVKNVLAGILNKEKYTIYDLPVNATDQLWNASTGLVVVCGSVTTKLTEQLLHYLISGGQLLCLCSDLLNTVLQTFATAEVREHELVRFSYGNWKRVKMMHHIFCYQASPAKKQFSKDSDQSSNSGEGSSPIAPRTPSSVEIHHNGKNYIVQVQVLGTEETWQTPSLLLASVKNSSGRAIFSQVHLEIDPTQYEDDESKFAALKDSNDARLEILKDILSKRLDMDCNNSNPDNAYLPGYFLGRYDLKLDMLKNCGCIADNKLVNEKVTLAFCGKGVDPGEASATRLPIMIHACPSNFSTVQYFEALEAEEIGRLVLYADVLASSQLVLDRKLRHGLVVIPKQQTEGVGRSNNTWLSPQGCAMFSLQLHIPLNTPFGQSLPLIQHFVMVAVISAIRNRKGYENLDVKIKWPNDLYAFSTTKIGGLVVKTILDSTENQAIVNIGCGINLSNKNPTICINDMIDKYNLEHSTHLKTIPYEVFLALIFNEIEKLYNIVQSGNMQHFFDLYKKYWLHTDQEITVINKEGVSQKVVVVGIDEFGYLKVRSLDGATVSSVQPDGNSFDMLKGLIAPKIV